MSDYSNRSTDRGGPTKYGVTHRTPASHRGLKSVTADQVKGISRKKAVDIYQRSFWLQCGGDLLPPGLDYAISDFAVNSGPARAVKSLQKVVGACKDGHIGEQTLAAVRKFEGGVSTLIRACDERMRFLRSLSNPNTGFPVNGRGGTIRVTGKDTKRLWKDQPGVIGNSVPPPRRALGIVKQLRSLREIAKKAGQALLLLLRQALPPAKSVYVPYLSSSLLRNLIGFNAFYHLAPPKAKEVSLCYLSLIKQEITK